MELHTIADGQRLLQLPETFVDQEQTQHALREIPHGIGIAAQQISVLPQPQRQLRPQLQPQL